MNQAILRRFEMSLNDYICFSSIKITQWWIGFWLQAYRPQFWLKIDCAGSLLHNMSSINYSIWDFLTQPRWIRLSITLLCIFAHYLVPQTFFIFLELFLIHTGKINHASTNVCFYVSNKLKTVYMSNHKQELLLAHIIKHIC